MNTDTHHHHSPPRPFAAVAAAAVAFAIGSVAVPARQQRGRPVRRAYDPEPPAATRPARNFIGGQS